MSRESSLPAPYRYQLEQSLVPGRVTSRTTHIHRVGIIEGAVYGPQLVTNLNVPDENGLVWVCGGFAC